MVPGGQPGINVGQASPYPATINVTGLTGTVTNISVILSGLSHTFPGDIDILLVSPGGENAIIMSDVGFNTPATGISLTLDDSAANSLPETDPLTSGVFRPANYDGLPDLFNSPAPTPAGGSMLSVFNGIVPNGIWRLYVMDNGIGDVGDISGGWALLVSTSTCGGNPTPTPTATPTATPTPGGGFESDVTPRPSGDNSVISGDVIQMRRFATGLDTPSISPNEFQRADAAPRLTFGDGAISSGDVIQARRYATGLDPATPAAGPTGPPPVPNTIASIFEDVYAYFFGREMRVTPQKSAADGIVTVAVEITPYGDEVAAGFTLEYDAAKLSNPRIELSDGAPAGAVLTTNTNEAGRIGILVDSTDAFIASAVPKRFLLVTFDLAPGATGETPISLTDTLAAKATADANGNKLTVRYLDGSIVLTAKSR